MKLHNSTDWEPWFLRRMISWCCRELEMPIKPLRVATFRNSRSSWGGACYGPHKITVCVSPREHDFPATTSGHWHGELKVTLADRLECLVEVTAHELAHARNWAKAKCRRGLPGGSEALTDTLGFAVLRTFREQRVRLLLAWTEPPATVRRRGPEKSAVQRRAEKANLDLEKWQRRLKVATTKVRKLKKRVQYYNETTTTEP